MPILCLFLPCQIASSLPPTIATSGLLWFTTAIRVYQRRVGYTVNADFTCASFFLFYVYMFRPDRELCPVPEPVSQEILSLGNFVRLIGMLPHAPCD